MVAAATSVPDRRLGAYRILRELGRGGMGLVCEAEDVRLGRRVAIKRLLPHLEHDPASIERFAREGRAACRVRHPAVVEVHEVFDHAGIPHLVMELLEGEHLGALIHARGALPLEELIGYLVPVAAGIATAHVAGVIHRDLKPSNVMLTPGPDGGRRAKVLDFGTSKLSDMRTDEALTHTGAMLGTLQYMSPEQLAQPRQAGPAADQYSLGAILYEGITGRRPFAGESCYALMQAIMTAPLVPPSQRRGDLPAGFDDVVQRAMDRRPERRFACVAELGLALLPYADAVVQAAWGSELSALAEELRRAPAAPAPQPPSPATRTPLGEAPETLPDPASDTGHAGNGDGRGHQGNDSDGDGDERSDGERGGTRRRQRRARLSLLAAATALCIGGGLSAGGEDRRDPGSGPRAAAASHAPATASALMLRAGEVGGARPSTSRAEPMTTVHGAGPEGTAAASAAPLRLPRATAPEATEPAGEASVTQDPVQRAVTGRTPAVDRSDDTGTGAVARPRPSASGRGSRPRPPRREKSPRTAPQRALELGDNGAPILD